MGIKEHLMRAVLKTATRIIYGNDTHADWAYEKIQHPRTALLLAQNFLNYYRRRPRISRISGVIVEPVFGCNLQCSRCFRAMCEMGDRPRFMDWDLYTRIVDQTPRHVETLTLSLGGEPLLHPAIHDMIAYAAKRGLRPILFTNGTLLEGEVLARVAASPLAVLNVSIDSNHTDAGTSKGILAGRVRDNLVAFMAAKRPETEVKLSLVVDKADYEGLDELVAQWKNLVQHMKISPFMGVEEAGPSPLCIEPWRGNLNVLTNGDVTPCCFDFGSKLKIGNLAEQSIADIAHGEAYHRLLAGFLAHDAPDRCRRCTKFAAPDLPLRAPRKFRGGAGTVKNGGD